MPALYELHSHLYGCLELEDLYYLAARSSPRWEIFAQSYRELYKKEAEIKSLFSKKKSDQERLSSYYYFKNKSGFRAFQNCFDLVVSLARADPEELKEVCLRVAKRESADYAEYRMMFPALLSDAEFVDKSLALCEALAIAEKSCTGKKKFRLVLSLSREDQELQRQYELIKTHLQSEDIVCKFLVGIDFCGQEEGYPPEGKKAFCREMLEDNRKVPSKSLAILYHVGESYEDKSVESAARWVVQAARMGAHRLGHAVALGVSPEFYLGKKKQERLCERLAQIDFEIENSASLKEGGYEVNIEQLEMEKESLLKKKKSQSWLSHEYDKKNIERLRLFQDWAIKEVKKTNTVIESCPTSNLRICALRSPKNHPLLRFLKAGLNVVIGADDPGILDTSLKEEYQRIESWPGITKGMIARLKRKARRWTAKKLAAKR